MVDYKVKESTFTLENVKTALLIGKEVYKFVREQKEKH